MIHDPGKYAFLPRLSGDEASALSRVAHHGGDLAVRLTPVDDPQAFPSSWRLAFTPGIAEATRQAASNVVDLDWAGARLRLGLPRAACDAWLAARLPGLDVGPLPRALVAAAVESVLADIVAGLAGVSPGVTVRVLECGTNGDAAAEDDRERVGDDPPHAWTVTVHAVSTGDLFYTTLQTDGLGLMQLANLLARVAPSCNALEPDDVAVAVRGELGATLIDVAEMTALRPGDVVLVDEYRVAADGCLWLVTQDGQGVQVRPYQSTFVVTQGWTFLMTDIPQSMPATYDDGGREPLDVDAIPVRLTFDLGERSMTLGELRRLQPGEIFTLDRPLDAGAVIVRANGAPVGSGELVEVDGRIAVTIRTLYQARR